DFFGIGGWSRVVIFRWMLAHPLLSLAIGVLFVVTVLVAGGVLIAQGRPFWAAGLYVLAFGVGASVGGFFLCGLADVTQFRVALDKLLRQKLFPLEPDRVVVMSDFGREGRPPLKIVSANLSRRQLHLFSPHRTPDVPVADAVAASICL